MYEIEKLIKETTLGGVPAGIDALDRITNGFQKGELTILAGRPGIGSESFALNIARNAAIDYQKNVVIFSLDKSSQKITKDILSTKLGTPFIDYECLAENKATLSNFEKAPVFIDDTQHLSIIELLERACFYNSEKKTDIIIISNLQLLKGESCEQVTRLLKILAKAMDIPVILLSQLPKSLELREGNKKPILEDLQAYGAIEKYTDLVLLMYRADYYGISADEYGNPISSRCAEIIIPKNRNGETSTSVRMKMSGMGNFTDIDEGNF